MTAVKDNKYAVPALDKGLDILEFLAERAMPLSQTEIAQGIDRSANEIYRVLVGLESRGYLVRDDISGKYSLSLKLYSLSCKVSPIDQLRQTAIPIMEDLAAQAGYASHLSILYQSKVMVIVQARSHAPVSLSIAEGTLFPTVQTSSGRILLANSSEPVKSLIYERDDTFKKMNKDDKQAFEKELVQVSQDGYLYRQSDITEGVTDCAAVIGEPEGAVIAALAVSSLTSTLGGEENKARLIQLVKETARKISERVGC